MVNILSTPAEQCDGPWSAFPDIPGFHDPRIFRSGKGEPLVVVNSASQYACVGLWITDLRTLYAPLKQLLTPQPGRQSTEPPISYQRLQPRTSTTTFHHAPYQSLITTYIKRCTWNMLVLCAEKALSSQLPTPRSARRVAPSPKSSTTHTQPLT